MEFLALVAQTSICGEIAGDVSKCRLFSQEEVKTNRRQKNPKRTSGTGCAQEPIIDGLLVCRILGDPGAVWV